MKNSFSIFMIAIRQNNYLLKVWILPSIKLNIKYKVKIPVHMYAIRNFREPEALYKVMSDNCPRSWF